jgi:hypothetical protein
MSLMSPHQRLQLFKRDVSLGIHAPAFPEVTSGDGHSLELLLRFASIISISTEKVVR